MGFEFTKFVETFHLYKLVVIMSLLGKFIGRTALRCIKTLTVQPKFSKLNYIAKNSFSSLDLNVNNEESKTLEQVRIL